MPVRNGVAVAMTASLDAIAGEAVTPDRVKMVGVQEDEVLRK